MKNCLLFSVEKSFCCSQSIRHLFIAFRIRQNLLHTISKGTLTRSWPGENTCLTRGTKKKYFCLFVIFSFKSLRYSTILEPVGRNFLFQPLHEYMVSSNVALVSINKRFNLEIMKHYLYNIV